MAKLVIATHDTKVQHNSE